MRFVVVALVVLCAFASASRRIQISDKGLLKKQDDVLRLFKYVNQPSYYSDYMDIGSSYNISAHYADYTDSEVAEHFYKMYDYGLLPRGEVFSVFYEEHLEQAVALYNVFYTAKDYDTFYNTAIWARQNVNEGLYLYSLSCAVVQREDTSGIMLPPIYEVYPYYFFNNGVIQEAFKYKQQYQAQEQHDFYTINANYSGFYLNLHPEQSMSYFTEDVGINSFYYYYNIYFPGWLEADDAKYTNERRGEFFYYIYQQLLARYYLERLCNGFGEIPYFNWEVPFETGYHSSLAYPNGLQFPSRPNFANLYEFFYNYRQKYGTNKYAYSYTRVQDYERRIRDAIDRGYVWDLDGKQVNLTTWNDIEVLGNLIDANADSPNWNYYGDLQEYARHLLGYSFQPLSDYQVAPSALEHFETSLRDPAFYQLYKRINLYFQQFQWQWPAYTEEELTWTGVEVTDVQFDRLVTYFDEFYADLSYALYVTPEEFNGAGVPVRAMQYRLNHKPFTYSIKVTSNQAQNASVRIYLGPKYDQYGRYLNFSENRQNFVQFDHFFYKLESGENVIQRDSNSSEFYQDDQISFQDLYHKVEAALKGDKEFNEEANQWFFGFPRRFMLPKGTYGGYEYQFYVIVSAYVEKKGKELKDDEVFYYDAYPFGYPFDRPIYYDQIFYDIPNAYVYTAKVYHTDFEEDEAKEGVRTK